MVSSCSCILLSVSHLTLDIGFSFQRQHLTRGVQVTCTNFATVQIELYFLQFSQGVDRAGSVPTMQAGSLSNSAALCMGKWHRDEEGLRSAGSRYSTATFLRCSRLQFLQSAGDARCGRLPGHLRWTGPDLTAQPSIELIKVYSIRERIQNEALGLPCSA